MSRARSAVKESAELFFSLWADEKARIETVAAAVGLSSAQACTLLRLIPDEPLPMSALACHMACDPSNITSIVDKLEARNLVHRRVAETDRRVKMLAVTREGAQLRQELLERLRQPPRWMSGLSRADQTQLRDILQRCVANLRRG